MHVGPIGGHISARMGPHAWPRLRHYPHQIKYSNCCRSMFTKQEKKKKRIEARFVIVLFHVVAKKLLCSYEL
jgi:hypothetical protein